MSRFILKQKNKIRILLEFPVKKLKTVSFTSSIMKKIVVFAIGYQAIFPGILNCCIAFGSGSSSWCLLKSIAIIL